MLLLLEDRPYKSFGRRLRTAFLVLGIPITILVVLPVLVILGQDVFGFLTAQRAATEHHESDFLDTAFYLIPIAGFGAILVLQSIFAQQHLHLSLTAWHSPFRAWVAIFAAVTGGLSALLWVRGTFHWHELSIIVAWEIFAVEEGMRWLRRRRHDHREQEQTDKK